MTKKSVFRWVYAMALILGVSGCATMFSDPQQNLSVISNPVGAKCTVQRNSVLLANIEATPGSFSIKRGMHDIETTCQKSGYSTVRTYKVTGFNKVSLWNLFNGGVGFVVDFATGSLFEYEEAPIYVGLTAN